MSNFASIDSIDISMCVYIYILYMYILVGLVMDLRRDFLLASIAQTNMCFVHPEKRRLQHVVPTKKWF